MKFIHHLDTNRVKKHIIISLLGISLGLVLYYYFASAYATSENAFSVVEALLAGLCGVLISYITYFISKRLDGLLSWSRRLSARFISGILIGFTVAFGLLSLLFLAYKKFDLGEHAELWQGGFIKLAILLFLIFLVYNIIYFALYSYYSYATLQIEGVAYERQQIELQLKALKSQLSSHFLFNNLNTISSLAFKDAEAAEKYIRGLANVYNYSLNSYHSKLVSLQEEVTMLESYLLLLKTRYGAHFDYDLAIASEKLTSKIPPLTLQMLVENAVKHNVMDSDHPLRIQIDADDNTIAVRNNITKAPGKVSSFNIGLKNIEARYQLLREKHISVVKDTDFTVTLPLIT